MHCLVRTPIERLLGVGAVVLGIATELLREVLTVAVFLDWLERGYQKVAATLRVAVVDMDIPRLFAGFVLNIHHAKIESHSRDLFIVEITASWTAGDPL